MGKNVGHKIGEIRLRGIGAFLCGRCGISALLIVILLVGSQRVDASSRADFDGDGVVGFSDVLRFVDLFGLMKADPAYDVRVDLDGDGNIGFGDFLLFVEAFGDVITIAPRSPQSFTSWAYQLQAEESYDVVEMGESPVDVVVMDYSHDGSPDRELTSEEVGQIRGAGSSRKVVLSYLSIGEAEVGRAYWMDEWIANDQLTTAAPAFLAKPNPSFPDNFKVRFWMKAWQDLIVGTPADGSQSYLDRIIDAGFDGVYLDIIDAFFYFGPEGEGAELKTEEEAADLMVDFVVALARHAREVRGLSEFLIVPQNGAFIVDSATSGKRDLYLSVIDGIGVEDTFFNGDLENDNALSMQEDVVEILKVYQGEGKFVLSVDYLIDPVKIATFYTMALAQGYVPYVSLRELDRFSFPVGYEPGALE